MDPDDYPGYSAGGKIEPVTFLSMLLAATLALCIVLLTISDLVQSKLDVGEIVVFYPDDGTLVWMQPGIVAAYASPHGAVDHKVRPLMLSHAACDALAGGS